MEHAQQTALNSSVGNRYSASFYATPGRFFVACPQTGIHPIGFVRTGHGSFLLHWCPEASYIWPPIFIRHHGAPWFKSLIER